MRLGLLPVGQHPWWRPQCFSVCRFVVPVIFQRCRCVRRKANDSPNLQNADVALSHPVVHCPKGDPQERGKFFFRHVPVRRCRIVFCGSIHLRYAPMSAFVFNYGGRTEDEVTCVAVIRVTFLERRGKLKRPVFIGCFSG